MSRYSAADEVSQLTGGGPWWEVLPADLYQQPDGTPIDRLHPFRVRGTAAMDRIVRSVLGGLISSALAPTLLHPGRYLEKEQRLAAFYQNVVDQGDIDAIYPRPPPGVEIHASAPGRLDFRPSGDIPAHVLEFDSPFEPMPEELRADWRRLRRNNRVRAMHWTHRSGPRPTLIFVHGFFADQYWLNSWMFSLPWLYRSGYDILLYTQPFHGSRREPGAPFSGFGFVAGGISQINESMRQSVFDLRILMDYLDDSGVPSMGISGLSLGGYLSALMCCIEDRLSFSIPNSPVVDMTDMGLEWLALRYVLQASMKVADMNVHQARHALAMHSPLSWQPRIEPKRLMLIGGAGDRVTPPRYLRLLHAHWEGSHLHWFPGNHIMHLGQRRYLKLMRWFMDRHTADWVRPD